jgi:hypothetical protein
MRRPDVLLGAPDHDAPSRLALHHNTFAASLHPTTLASLA